MYIRCQEIFMNDNSFSGFVEMLKERFIIT